MPFTLFFFPGVDSIGFDPQRFAMDYHIIGFRECASEVARYLVTIEGLDIQDPLRLRLISHLQCFVAQREISVKSTVAGVSGSNWSSLQNSFQPSYPSQSYQGYPVTSPITPQQQQSNQINQNSFNSSYMPNAGSSSTYISTITPQSPDYNSSGYGTTNSSISSAPNTTATNNTSTASPTPNQTPTTDQQQVENQHPVYTDLSNTNDRLLLGGNYLYGNANQLYGSGNNHNNNNYNTNNNNSKPYRPWHPEMAY